MKTRNVAVGVEWLQRTAYDVGMVLLDNGGTASSVCRDVRSLCYVRSSSGAPR